MWAGHMAQMELKRTEGFWKRKLKERGHLGDLVTTARITVK
jgi:hypothetical protein